MSLARIQSCLVCGRRYTAHMFVLIQGDVCLCPACRAAELAAANAPDTPEQVAARQARFGRAAQPEDVQ